MPWLGLIPWRVVGIFAVLLSVWGYGYYGGLTHERKKQQAIAVKQIADVLAEERARQDVSAKVDTKHQAATEKVRTVTRTIIKVIRDEKPSADCNLSNGWVRLHNAAADGTLPDSTGVDHAKPSGITADLALETVAGNYGTCHEVRQIALDCQGWIRQQQGVK